MIARFVRFCAALVAVALIGCGAEAQIRQPSAKAEPGHEWPRFLGPAGTGVSEEAGWDADWPEEGPKRLWKAKVGVGFGSIAVGGGRAITVGHEGGQDTVWAFDAVSGETLWKQSYDSALVDYLYEGGPNATPTIDGNRVYTLGKEGELFALNADNGTVVWQADFRKEFGTEMPAWGFSSSPLVVGELVIVDAGPVAAFDKRSGKVVWKTDMFRPGYGTATAFTRGGEQLVAVLNNDFLLVLKAKDGAEVARHEWETSFATSACTPLVKGDTIFISTGYGQGCGLFKFSENKLELVYDNKKMRNHFSNSVPWKDSLFGFDGQSNNSRVVKLVCMDYASGEVRWEQRGHGCGSLIISDGKLIILSDEGELVIAEASAEAYKPLAKAQVLEGRCWTTPALAKGRIYCRNAVGDLVCLDVRKDAARETE